MADPHESAAEVDIEVARLQRLLDAANRESAEWQQTAARKDALYRAVQEQNRALEAALLRMGVQPAARPT